MSFQTFGCSWTLHERAAGFRDIDDNLAQRLPQDNFAAFFMGSGTGRGGQPPQEASEKKHTRGCLGAQSSWLPAGSGTCLVNVRRVRSAVRPVAVEESLKAANAH